MLFLKKFLSFICLSSLIITNHLVAFAQDTNVDVSITVIDQNGDLFGEVTVYVYTLDDLSGEYNTSNTGYATNSETLTNVISVPVGTTFYVKAFDSEGNVYSQSDDPENDSNTWIVLSENLLENLDTGSTRIPFVELYIAEETLEVVNTSELEDSIEISTNDELYNDNEVEMPAIMTPVVDAGDYDLFELDVYVYDQNKNAVMGAEVFVYVEDLGLFTYDSDFDGIYESGSITTDENGVTSNLLIPKDYEFYVFALSYNIETGDVGTSYGGTYDNYYDRANYWVSNDGISIKNIATGEVSPSSLILHPGTLLPWDIEDEDDFDESSYLCGGFEDAIFNELTFEECEAIEFVLQEGIFEGTEEGLLEPFRAINRAEVTKVMVEYFKTEIIADISNLDTFPDVANGKWYTNYVYTAKANKIVGGYPDGSFKPEEEINKVEMLKILIEASGTTEDISYSLIPEYEVYFNDIQINTGNSWFIRYANYAYFNKLIENDGNLNPTESMTRMDVIKLLYRTSLI